MKKNNLWRKSISLGVSAVMVFSLAACGSKGNQESGNSSGQETNRSTDQGAEDEEIVILKAFTIGQEPAAGTDIFYEQLDALTVKDLGIKVRFDYIPWGDEKNEINLSIISGEYDLYVGGNFSDFKVMAAKNAFLDLKPLLSEVPELAAHYSVVSDKTLESCEIGGKLYGIPQFGKVLNGVMADEGFMYREDLRKEWELPHINSLETMEQYMYKAMEEYPESSVVMDNRIWSCLWNILAADKYLEIGSYMDTPYVVVSIDDPYTVIDRTQTPEFKIVLEYASKWYRDGIIDHDILTLSANEGTQITELVKADKKVNTTNSPAWSLTATVNEINNIHPEWEMGWYDYVFGKAPVYLPSVVNATCISINPNCKEAVKALQFIEKAHTDQNYYDLLRWGVEGVNYNRIDGKITTVGIGAKNVKPSWTGLIDGYMEEETLSASAYWQEQMDATRMTPEEFSPLDGFIYDLTGLSAETAAMESVKTQYMTPLLCGITQSIEVDYENLQIQLKKAGIEKYIAQLQRQMDIFMEEGISME